MRNQIQAPAQDLVRQQARLLVLLDAALAAGVSPVPVGRVHVIAYLSDVLSPVWHLQPFDGTVLKQAGGPFYPQLQYGLDRLVGRGLVAVERVGYASLGAGRARLEGYYSVNLDLALPILEFLQGSPEEARQTEFMRELLLGLSVMSDGDIDRAFLEDATYSSRRVGRGNVIEFSDELADGKPGEGGNDASRRLERSNVVELRGNARFNYSANAAERIGELLPTSSVVGASEKLHLYFRHLKTRLRSGG